MSDYAPSSFSLISGTAIASGDIITAVVTTAGTGCANINLILVCSRVI